MGGENQGNDTVNPGGAPEAADDVASANDKNEKPISSRDIFSEISSPVDDTGESLEISNAIDDNDTSDTTGDTTGDNNDGADEVSTDDAPDTNDDGNDDDNVLVLENNEDDTPDDILLSRIESLIFIYPEPITVRRLARHLSLTGKRVRELVSQLKDHYAQRGINLSEISGGFQFHTAPQNAEVIRTLTKSKPLRMSRPALETLAIVAYKQPCTRAEVEDVRRVDCGGTLKFLFEKELVRVLGRKEEPGRPIIYGTSNKFLELFNLKSLSDLPSLHEYTELWDEHKELVDEDADENTAESEVADPMTESHSKQQEIPVDRHLDISDEPPAQNDVDSDMDFEPPQESHEVSDDGEVATSESDEKTSTEYLTSESSVPEDTVQSDESEALTDDTGKLDPNDTSENDITEDDSNDEEKQ